jgi:hypothetical protein
MVMDAAPTMRWSPFEWGTKDADVYLQMVDDFFDADANADGLMTWSELNKWLSLEGSTLG